MSRDGPSLKPGTRSYDRSWIRDGTMMGDTLLRLGQPEMVRAFADWYGTKLFAHGKVPCCVDARGPDPVPENDGQGEYVHLVSSIATPATAPRSRATGPRSMARGAIWKPSASRSAPPPT